MFFPVRFFPRLFFLSSFLGCFFLDDFFGEAGDGFLSGLDGAGEHEADGVKELHAGFAEAAAAARATTAGREPRSISASDGGCGGGPGFGDGFFDEGLLDAGAHVAGGELDEVFGFVGSGAGEEIEEEAEFGRGAAGFGDSGEGGFDFGEGDGGVGGRVAVEEVGGGGSESPWRR